MDSLLANYASSDEEEEEEEKGQELHEPRQPRRADDDYEEDYRSKPTSKSTGIFSSLPPTKSTYASDSSSPFPFSSLPPPKAHSPDPSNPLPNPLSSNATIPEDEDEEEFGDSTVSSLFGKNQSSFTAHSSIPKAATSMFSSLPQPKLSSISNPSMPQSKPSFLFSSLPPPKTQKSGPVLLSNSSPSSDSNPKRIVQFRPPIDPSLMKSGNADSEDEENDEKGKQRNLSKESESSAPNSSVRSFLSSLPKPKNSATLGSLPSASGSGRRSILEADASASGSNISSTKNQATVHMEFAGSSEHEASGSDPSDWDPSSQSNVYGGYVYNGGDDSSNQNPSTENCVNYHGYGSYGNAGGNPSTWGSATENYANYYNYEAYSNYGHYESNQVDGSTATMEQQMLRVSETESSVKVTGKRGRNEIPQEIVEVKQEELMKNRPREDQVKLTGIAFGPSYQPVSAKGKPSKLHKRKHQIGSLFYDMKQKEMELAERRAKGFLTKAETQAKYGW